MSMYANTIKVENPLLSELHRFKPRNMSLSAFVRLLLEKAIRRQKMAKAAEQYAEWLAAHPDESAWLDEWDAADLAKPPKTVKRRKKP